ncbi:hypothetical protein CRD36_10495 [Paremcibacter congregatus]|uniref:Dipeptidase n=2 Tax=Paremcibacter congregatus TaxID=2043170 RepID=A0A2G4YQY8_9PROT|nr:membrane dipeptidase [Paremcibacter congregatus]PHZ84707.1 hypothetical protein CRD36_10495 [Paremcibacter congregatus]QDE28902.1 hypothetical protein FIV45_17260 [Paremcibacter congregatus]
MMINRRTFTLGVAAGTALAGLGLSSRPAFAAKKLSSQSALVIDAMGEIRSVYSKALIREILDSGMNSIAITLCDPKTFEQDAYQSAIQGILEYNAYLEAHPDLFIKGERAADILTAQKQDKLSVFYLAQNSTQFGRDLDNVDVFYDLGMRSSQVTYNYQNWAGAGCKEKHGSGLTVFGHELVEKMNDVRMLIDLSHAGMQTMADSIKASKEPVVISHTCCKALNDNERNTTDENLKAMAQKGGVVGICQMRPFMTDKKKDALPVYFDHILHAIKVAGIDHVAIGSDRDHRRVNMTPEYIAELRAEEGANFNDAHWPLYFEELNGPRRMEVIWDGLHKRGLTEDQLEKVMGQNLYRLYETVIG